MPEWMATRVLALLLGLSGGFAAHYTLLIPRTHPLTGDDIGHRTATSPRRRTNVRRLAHLSSAATPANSVSFSFASATGVFR
jgi:hypothetical protein